MPDVYECVISDKEKLNNTVYRLIIASEQIAMRAKAGQFLHIKCGKERILRRPISISDVNNNKVSIVVEIRGEGTKWLCETNTGDTLDIMGPLGNGFCIPEGNTIVVGGGVGVPPLLLAAKSTKHNTTAILGFRDKGKKIMLDDFESICQRVYVTTDDGSYGIHGTVITPLKELLANDIDYASVLTCGPRLMMESVAKLCREKNIPCLVSLEERMGCGIGACMVCACETIRNEAKNMSHVCIDGPVFDANEVLW